MRKKKAVNKFSIKQFYKSKIFIFISLGFFIFFIIGSMSIIYSENEFFFNIKKKIPTSIKKPIKKIFYFTIIERENKDLKNEIYEKNRKIIKLNNRVASLESDLYAGKKISEEIIELDNINFHLKKIFLPYTNLSNKKNIKNGYLALFEDNLIIVYWSGKIISININELTKDQLEIFEIDSNLSNFVKQNDKFISIKDTLIINDTMFVSYTKNISKDNCLNISIAKTQIKNLERLKFEDFFTYKDCLKGRFGGYQAGGRLEKFKENKLLLSTGDFQNFGPSQKLDNNFGKVISIDMETKKTNFLSLGHRNPQGLLYLEKRNILMSTEHGQKGGDEINKILLNENKIPNYGWPISSYSDYYGYEDFEIRKKAPLYKSHEKYGFIEPIKYFTPSLGISQLVEAKNFNNNFNENTLIVSSLKNKKLYFLEFNNDFSNVVSQNSIEVGERIRDIVKFQNDKYLLFLEGTPALGILSINY